jgi:DNA-binding FadR family transcriptional regulator
VVRLHADGALRKLTPDMLHLSSGHDFPHPVKEWESIYDKIEIKVIRQSILSECQLNAVSLAEMNELELDMHERLLQYANNKVAMVALRSAKAGLISSKHIVGSKEVPLESNEPFIEEHISILEAISRQNRDESKLRLQAHLL